MLKKNVLLFVLLVPSLSRPQHVVDQRPTYLRVDVGVGSPIGFAGGSIGTRVWDRTSLELGVGLGATGWQVAILTRHFVPIGNSPDTAWTFGGGPSVGLLSRSFGINVPHRDDIAVAQGDKPHSEGGGR